MIELKGKPVADSVFAKVTDQLAKFAEKKWQMPHLVVVLVGNDPASEVYVSHKQQACKKLNIKSTLVKLPFTATQLDVQEAIEKLNFDDDVDAILLQLPLPKNLNSKNLTEAIAPNKDADGLTQASLGALVTGQQIVASCTPSGIIEILNYYKIPLAGKKVAVIGRSLIVGLPMFHLLLQQDASVSVFHSKTENLKSQIAEYDLVVVAIGKPQILKATDFKRYAVVVDVGIHRLESGLCGDVDPSGADGHLSALSPVPGGVGPMTIAMLMQNTVTLATHHRMSLS